MSKLNGYNIVKSSLNEASPELLKRSSDKAKLLYGTARDPYLASKYQRQIHKFKRAAQRRWLNRAHINAIKGESPTEMPNWVVDR